MALAVDTKHLLDEWIPQREWLYNHNLHLVDGNDSRRLLLHRVCVQATVIHDAATRAQLITRYWDPRQPAPLECKRPEQGDDSNLDQVETLFHNLDELAATSTSSTKPGAVLKSPPTGLISKAGTTTSLVASVALPSSSPSSFPRYSCRTITEHCSNGASSRRCCLLGLLVDCGYGYTDIRKAIPSFPVDGISLLAPRIASTNVRERYHSVIWHVQLDFLEISGRSSCIIPASVGRRSSQTALKLVHQEALGCQDEKCSGKKFKGVRYRHDRHRWVAEMKPPKSKNKVFFGQFQSETEAARVVDVALHHYGKALNFADTPQILAEERSSAGLGDDEKLKLVKQQAKWVASITSTLPSSPALSRGTSCTIPSHPRLENMNLEPSGGCSAASVGFRSFSEILSSLGCGGTPDEADDGVSQPHDLLNLMASLVGKEAKGVNLDMAHQACVVDEFGGNLSVENAIAEPCDVGVSLEYFVNSSAV